MRNIPAVSYPVGSSGFQLFSKWIALLIAAVVQVLWWIQNPERSWVQIAALLLWSIPASLILRESFRPVVGVLRWTGQAWTWDSDEQTLEGHVVPRLDFQSSILLEFRAQGTRTIWLWLSSQSDAPHWAPLRHAIWSILREDGQQVDALADPS
jgi:hypothetical protein